MLKEVTRVCPQTLHKMMREKDIAHHEVAQALGISTKTVQRWLNGSTKTMSPEMAVELGKILSVPTSALTLNSSNIRRRPTNKILAKLTSAQKFEMVRAREDWADYIDLLSTFVKTDVSSDQEMKLHLCLGVSNLYLGIMKAGQIHLSKALKIAEDLQDAEHIALTMAWIAIFEELRGNHHEVRAFIRQLRALYNPNFSPSILVTLHLVIGRLQVNTKDLEGAEVTLKKGIILGLKNRKESLARIAVMTYYLGWIYLKKRDLKKAQVYFKRLLEASTQAGWTRGLSIGYHALAVTESFIAGEITPHAERIWRKGRSYRKIDNARQLETKVEQLSFVLAMLRRDYTIASSICQKRYEAAKTSIEFSAYVTVDMLFLAKMKNSNYEMKPGLISKARAIIKKGQLHQVLEVLNYLESVSEIDTKTFIELYTFL